jgi:hypothetical protein
LDADATERTSSFDAGCPVRIPIGYSDGSIVVGMIFKQEVFTVAIDWGKIALREL